MTTNVRTVPDSMRAYRLVQWQQPPQLVSIPVPTPAAGEVLVAVRGNGLCHSDITMMELPGEIGAAIGWDMPFTLGHEAAGEIVEIGSDVHGWHIGDQVVLISANSCGTCRFCAGGRESLCTDAMAGRGYGRDGGLAEYVIAPARDLIRWEGSDIVDAGTLSDAGATSYHAVQRVLPALRRAVAEGHHPSVAVIGIGGLGFFAVQILAALSDATIIAVEADPTRRSQALELGAHHAIDGVDRATAAQLREIAGPSGVEAVIDLVGIDDTINQSLKALSKGGVYALVGAGGGTLRAPWINALPHEAEVFTFQGSRPEHVRAVVELAASGRIRVETERFALDDVAVAYDRLHHGTLTRRAVVVP